MKIIKDLFCLLFGVALFGVLTWSLLYLCVPEIKDDTNKLFKWGDYATVEEEPDKGEEVEVISPACFKFENDNIAVIVG